MQEHKRTSPSRRPPSEVYHGAEWEQLEGHLILNGNMTAQINSCPFKFPIKRKTTGRMEPCLFLYTQSQLEAEEGS